MKIGLEKEFFCLNEAKELQIIGPESKLPHDEYILLAEARGNPRETATLAVHDLFAECHRMGRVAEKEKLILTDAPIMTVSREMNLRIRRVASKGIISFQNLYGFTDHRHRRGECTAGVHISFTHESSYHYTERNGDSNSPRCFTYNKLWDFPQLFMHLDRAFKEELKATKRNPGFYEIKGDGRVEYRSLPANVDLLKLADVVDDYLAKH